MTNDRRILLERTVPSTKRELMELPRLLEEIRPHCPMSDDQFYNLVIALTEAINNAIVHGNRMESERNVHYRLECRADGVACLVEDEGEGFDPAAVADPISPENLLRDGGRGIFIIRALMREFELEDTGHGMRVSFVCPRE